MTETRRRRSLEDQIIEETEKPCEPIEELVGPDPSTITDERLIPSGLTLLNCGCSDNPFGAFVMGSINTIPGRSSSGKSELMLLMQTMCAINPRFDNHILIQDDAEHSSLFDLEYMFPPLVGRLKAPRYDGDLPLHSETIEDFEATILQLCKKSKQPFIYVLDSLDTLASTAELEREWKNALKNVKDKKDMKDIEQSYNTEKARKIHQVLRLVNSHLKKSDSALFIVQQTKQNFNKQFMYDPDWITNGGKGPFFYSFHRIFLDTGAAIKEESRNMKHQIGSHTRCEVVKNKLTGKKRKKGIEFDIYDDYGIDDVGSCVDFLIATEEFVKESGGYYIPKGLSDKKMYRKDVIGMIEEEALERELRIIVGKVWNEIEDDIRPKNRKRRF